MLVVFSGNTSWSMYKFRLAVMKDLQRRGFDVVVVAPFDEFTQKLRDENIEVHDVATMKRSGINPMQDFQLYQDYLNIYKALRPNIIFHYTIKPNIYGTFAAKKLKIPSVSIVTGLGYTFIHKTIISAIVVKMYAVTLRKACQVWFLNNDDRHIFESKKIVSKNKMLVINGEGIDTETYNFEPIDVTTRSFIIVARLLYDKGINEYYKAAKKLKAIYPEVQFKILGYLNVDNPMAINKTQIDEWVNSGVIDYLGSTPDVRPYLINSTCVVLPSYREGISVTLMEGASMGRPLIASNISGCKELIDDGESGFLCKVKDANDLADKMELVIKMDNERLREMSKKGRAKILKQFDVNYLYPIYVNAINKFAVKDSLPKGTAKIAKKAVVAKHNPVAK